MLFVESTSPRLLAMLMGLVALLVIGAIVLGKYLLNVSSKKDLLDPGVVNMSAFKKKYDNVDIFKNTGLVRLFSLVLVLFMLTATMNLTLETQQDDGLDYEYVIEEDIEIEPPRTQEPPPPPPPPPPSLLVEIPDEVFIEEDEIEFIDQTIEEETVVVAPPRAENKPAPPPPPPPPPPEEDVEEIFRVVEQMPRFPGCEGEFTADAELKACAEKKLLEFIYDNIRYPAIALENGIQGNVVIGFIVDRSGSIMNIEILRDIGGGCGDEAKRVIELMNNMDSKWIPGRQNGRAVKVAYTMPVKFAIQNS